MFETMKILSAFETQYEIHPKISLDYIHCFKHQFIHQSTHLLFVENFKKAICVLLESLQFEVSFSSQI